MSVDEEVEEVDFEEDDEDVDKTQTRIVMVGEKDLEGECPSCSLQKLS